MKNSYDYSKELQDIKDCLLSQLRQNLAAHGNEYKWDEHCGPVVLAEDDCIAEAFVVEKASLADNGEISLQGYWRDETGRMPEDVKFAAIDAECVALEHLGGISCYLPEPETDTNETTNTNEAERRIFALNSEQSEIYGKIEELFKEADKKDMLIYYCVEDECLVFSNISQIKEIYWEEDEWDIGRVKWLRAVPIYAGKTMQVESNEVCEGRLPIGVL